MEYKKQKLWQAPGCLLCAAVALRFTSDLEGTEFSGGRITGPLLNMQNAGALLFILALIVTFLSRRAAAAITLLAGLLCLPLYLCFTAPGPFRSIFKGEWKTPLSANFVWDWWSIAGIVTVAIAVYACLRSLKLGDRGTSKTMLTRP
jgi:formate hydrogenlyase subunit 3/multisubunit Na+/H+ antiporter MnhD subunit